MRDTHEAALAALLAASAVAAGCGRPGNHSATTSPPPTASAMSTQPAPAAPETLGADEVLPLVAQVDAEDAELLGDHPSAFTYAGLPFYARAGLRRATALLPTRPVQFRYVYARGAPPPAGRRLLPLGTPERVAAANAAAGLRLTPATAVAYLRFYLEASGGEARTQRTVVERAADVRWLPGSESDLELRPARERAAARVRAARAEPAADGGVRVSATALRGRALEDVTWHVAPDGRVTVERAAVLDADVPVVEVL